MDFLDVWLDDILDESVKKWGISVCWDYLEHGACYCCRGYHPKLDIYPNSKQNKKTCKVSMDRYVPVWAKILNELGFYTSIYQMNKKTKHIQMLNSKKDSNNSTPTVFFIDMSMEDTYQKLNKFFFSNHFGDSFYKIQGYSHNDEPMKNVEPVSISNSKNTMSDEIPMKNVEPVSISNSKNTMRDEKKDEDSLLLETEFESDHDFLLLNDEETDEEKEDKEKEMLIDADSDYDFLLLNDEEEEEEMLIGA